jgi:hypothetical protein
MAGDGTEQAEDGLTPWDEDALETLLWNWGEAYEIGAWRAKRRDGLGGWFEADGPQSLDQEITENYAMKPVPRDAGTRM